MLKRSSIGWCDYSAGPLNIVIRGRNCPVSEGCVHCYVERDFKRYGREMTESTTIYPEKLSKLWKTKWESGDTPYRRGPGSKPIMFLADYGDLFCEDVPTSFIFEVLEMCKERSDADWVLLTKRPMRMLDITNYWLDFNDMGMLPPNIWCMGTIENQRRADERIPMLLQVKAQVLGLSIEPMLGPVDLWKATPKPCWIREQDNRKAHGFAFQNGIDFVIVGAESGPDRRPFEVAWAEDVYQQCHAAGVAYFGKQDSGLRPGVPLLVGGKEVKEFPQP